MTDDLIERLRTEPSNPDMDNESADALEERDRRIAELERLISDVTGMTWQERCGRERHRAEKAERHAQTIAEADAKVEAELAAARAALRPRPESEWHEDMGDVLWFHFPVQEPPWVGTPLTNTWIEDWYTHFIPLPNFNEIHDAIAAARGEQQIDGAWKACVWQYGRWSGVGKARTESMARLLAVLDALIAKEKTDDQA